ncbi:hypothetical protein [Jeotgalibacillus soli]|uniref:hypothetical protein n=1 Tax=Jeotgalibacillus soli TaxID=889306 RepID=UPI0012FE8411|nr:hypothetical protein [Jeotgalibacillus soli]
MSDLLTEISTHKSVQKKIRHSNNSPDAIPLPAIDTEPRLKTHTPTERISIVKDHKKNKRRRFQRDKYILKRPVQTRVLNDEGSTVSSIKKVNPKQKRVKKIKSQEIENNIKTPGSKTSIKIQESEKSIKTQRPEKRIKAEENKKGIKTKGLDNSIKKHAKNKNRSDSELHKSAERLSEIEKKSIAQKENPIQQQAINEYLIQKNLTARYALVLGDRITVYSGKKIIDTGRFIFISNDYFLWVDREGHLRFQFIDVPLTIKKH